MSIRIEYQPTTLTYEAFHRVDSVCFPQEAMDAKSFAAAMTMDYWVAWDGDIVAGFAFNFQRPELSWLRRIGVAPEYRCQGIASALMRTFLEHCRHIGLPNTILYVRTDNVSAIRLYERFGFRDVESTYQFLLANPTDRLAEAASSEISAIPICDLPQSSWPLFPQEWANIAEMHQPPDSHVFVFRQQTNTVGYCRLNPRFPGCFPFVVERPSENLMPALRSIRDCLQPGRPVLKLTISDPLVASACRESGFELNYELFKMLRSSQP